VEIHLAVLLYTFLQAGLLEAIVEVIVSSDTFICVRASVLLGNYLWCCTYLRVVLQLAY
jgi:rapamycin-insensitive companion of mTOR